MGTIGALISTAELSELPFRLYLQAALVADQMKFEDQATVVYEFLSKVYLPVSFNSSIIGIVCAGR